jgi:hypothetical protein
MAAALYPTVPSNITGPAVGGFAITPSNTVDLPFATRAIMVGQTGDIAVIFANDATNTPVILYNRQGGTTEPVMIKRVMVTGTTATQLTGIY